MNYSTSKLQSSNSLLENLKFSQTDSNYEMNWSTSKLQSSNSLLDKLKFSQTDSNYEKKWLTSKLQSSISLLEKLKFSQTDSNYKKNWYTSKLESSNSSLTNPVYGMNKKKTNNLRELIQYIKKIDFSQFFKAWVACMKKVGTNFIYEATWKK